MGVMKIASHNPHDYSIVGEVDASTEADVVKAVSQAHDAFPAWRALGVTGRVKALRAVVQNLSERKEEGAQVVTKEMGMPISASRQDAQDAMDYFAWYLNNAEKYLAPE